jgi:tetraacyldisaccharide 4'-kinase
VVRRLQALGRRPAILTRGYKSTAGEPADEVLECHAALPVVPVIVNPDRVAGAAAAQREHNADCLVLDDGFQHRRLARDLDIVLIDALRPWDSGWVLPAGRLREPRDGLRRADVVVITRANQALPGVAEVIEAEVRQHGGKLIVRADVEADALVTRDERRAPPTDLAGRSVLAVCGIGNPQTFEKLVSALTGAECHTVAFADHHRYSAADVAGLGVTARRAGVELVVTTRKDWVKLAPLWSDAQVGLARVDVRLVLRGAVEEFDARLRQAVG